MRTLAYSALIRSLRTTCQTLGGMIPVGIVITPAILQGLDWSFAYVILAWLATGLLAGLGCFLTCIVAGLPEVDKGRHEE